MALTVTVADVAAYLPDAVALTDPDRLQRLINVAVLRLEAAVPSVEARVTAGVLPIELVHGGVADVVARVASNPDPGVRTSTVTTGPYSSSSTRVAGSDRITWTAGDLAPLQPPPASPLAPLGVARLGVEAYQVPG